MTKAIIYAFCIGLIFLIIGITVDGCNANQVPQERWDYHRDFLNESERLEK
jgi:hypothetical protein